MGTQREKDNSKEGGIAAPHIQRVRIRKRTIPHEGKKSAKLDIVGRGSSTVRKKKKQGRQLGRKGRS